MTELKHRYKSYGLFKNATMIVMVVLGDKFKTNVNTFFVRRVTYIYARY